MQEKEMDEVEFFKIRPLGTEEKGFIITAGNMIASKKSRAIISTEQMLDSRIFIPGEIRERQNNKLHSKIHDKTRPRQSRVQRNSIMFTRTRKQLHKQARCKKKQIQRVQRRAQQNRRNI